MNYAIALQRSSHHNSNFTENLPRRCAISQSIRISNECYIMTMKWMWHDRRNDNDIYAVMLIAGRKKRLWNSSLNKSNWFLLISARNAYVCENWALAGQCQHAEYELRRRQFWMQSAVYLPLSLGQRMFLYLHFTSRILAFVSNDLCTHLLTQLAHHFFQGVIESHADAEISTLVTGFQFFVFLFSGVSLPPAILFRCVCELICRQSELCALSLDWRC